MLFLCNRYTTRSLTNLVSRKIMMLTWLLWLQRLSNLKSYVQMHNLGIKKIKNNKYDWPKSFKKRANLILKFLFRNRFNLTNNLTIVLLFLKHPLTSYIFSRLIKVFPCNKRIIKESWQVAFVDKKDSVH